MKTPLLALAAAAVLTVTACSSTTESAAPKTTLRTTLPPAATPSPTTSSATRPSVVPVAAATPCTTNRKPKAVLVRLSAQHVWFCERSQVVRDSAITSGMKGQYTETPTGRYTIQSRNRNSTLTLADGKQYAVKYWIPFDGPLFGFHDSSWQKFPYGSAQYETDGSHGCVHLPLTTIAFLYRWGDVGTSVRIRA